MRALAKAGGGVLDRPKRAPRLIHMPAQCPRPDGQGVKLSYRSRAKARKAIAAHNGSAGKALHTYECPACGLWHLTSSPQNGGSAA